MKRVSRNRFEEDVRDYFLKQVDVNIDEYRDEQTRQFDDKNMVSVDWNSIPRSQQRSIQEAANASYSRYRVVDNGAWIKSIIPG